MEEAKPKQAAAREPLPRELSGRRDMPLVEELERLRAELAAAKARLAATTAEIPRLKTLIESTNGAVAKGQEEERRKQAALDALRRRLAGLGRGQDDALRRVLSELTAARGAKDALERRALVRRQVARALRLAERALAAEAHALAWSATAAAETLRLAAGAAGDEAALHHDVVALPARTHEELRRAVEAEERRAEARVEEAEAARRAARARRAAAVARLDAARARRREAAEAGQDRHGRDADDMRQRRGKMEKGRGQTRGRLGSRARLVVKKLGGFLCSKVRD
ncbi:hypothetical protein BRADI_1g21170v3 [Brachypodium distachyon]|uniref:Uncharacterized protein n=1 Tax=Brachypodium distachyon TaxID=15368 RepID=A0A0Q3JBC9_BRADI|nr:hypothetical protein BRADI_1g21170v3 [Brachypodium distachyon]